MRFHGAYSIYKVYKRCSVHLYSKGSVSVLKSSCYYHGRI